MKAFEPLLLQLSARPNPVTCCPDRVCGRPHRFGPSWPWCAQALSPAARRLPVSLCAHRRQTTCRYGRCGECDPSEGAHGRCQVGGICLKHTHDDCRPQFGADGARSIHQSWRKVLTGYSAPACQQPCQRLMAALGASQSTPDAFYLSEESGCPTQSSAGGHLVVGPSFIGRSDALIRVYRNRSKRMLLFCCRSRAACGRMRRFCVRASVPT